MKPKLCKGFLQDPVKVQFWVLLFITHGITITTNKSKVVNRSLIVELLEHRLRASEVSADLSIKTDFLFFGQKKFASLSYKKA